MSRLRLVRLGATALGFVIASLARAEPAVAMAPQATLAIGQPSVRASKLTGTLSIDGHLDESAWGRGAVATGFRQRRPASGQPASERTDARFLFDGEALYVGVWLYDSDPNEIVGRLFRRDDEGHSDWVAIEIDSYHDRRTAFSFAVNPRGVKRDLLRFDDTEEDVGWDAIWDVGVARRSDGWSAEFRIPFAQLRFNAVAGIEHVWGVNIRRDIARRQEVDYWAPILAGNSRYVSYFGELLGIELAPSSTRFEAILYAVGQVRHDAGAVSDDPLNGSLSGDWGVGGDLKVGLTTELTLSATVNPDFAQVEVDPAIINLTAYETFFPERRPFFLEGAEAFTFGRTITFNTQNQPTLFYSRRIGARPPRALSPAEYTFVDEPDATTIGGAAKVTGQTGTGWRVGLLDALTLGESARAVNLDGETARVPVAPVTNYAAASVRRELAGGQRRVGAFVTAVNRDLDDGLETFLPRHAYVFGAEGAHIWGHREWAVSSVVAGSHLGGEPEAIRRVQRSSVRYMQRPDGDHLGYDEEAESLAGLLGELSLSKIKGESWLGSLTYQLATPGFDSNDFGFQPRADSSSLSGLALGFEEQPTAWLRENRVHFFANQTWNLDGESVGSYVALRDEATFQNLWTLDGRLFYFPPATDDRLTRGGPAAASPHGGRAQLKLGSDPRARFVARAESQLTLSEVQRELQLSAPLQFSVTHALAVGLTPSYLRGRNEAQFVDAVADPTADQTFGVRHVFATVEQREIAVEARADWVISPRLSVQLVLRPYLATAQFQGFKEFLRPGELNFGIYGAEMGAIEPTQDGGVMVDPDGPGQAPTFTLANPDFSFRALQGKAVVRWEFLPGSALFLVWQHEREGIEAVGDLRFGRDARELFDQPAVNTVFVKISYWLN